MKRILGLFIFSLLIFIPLACHIGKNIPEITDKHSAREIISSRPVAWWKFDDIERPTAFDSSGNNNHGRVYGATWSDRCLSFDGVNDYVRIPNAPLLNPKGSFSIDAWIFPTADKFGIILAKWGGIGAWADQRSYSFNTYFGRRLNFAISDDAHQQDGPFHTCFTPDGVLTLNAWNYVTAVYDKSTGTRKIYVNGTKVAERTDTPINLTISMTDVGIGAYQSSSTTFLSTFPGLISEVKIYNYTRSADQIKADYNLNYSIKHPTSGIISSKPVAWWKFDDIEGPTAFDSSGNNNHGRVYGATWSDRYLSFDGVNDYVRIPNAPLLNLTGSFSIDAWIFPTADKEGYILIKWGDTGDWTNQRSYSFCTDFGRRLVFGISDDAHQQNTPFHFFPTPEGVLTLNAWNHVTAVYDKSTGTRKIYVNGAKVAERTDGPINLTISMTDVGIGAYQSSSTTFLSTFPGLINEVKIYNYARSAAEIQTDYNNAPNIGITKKKYEPVTSEVTWTQMKPARAPSARSVYAMAYDSARQRTVLFGGSTTGYDSLRDTWEWDGTNWTRKKPANSPSKRGYLAMAYDSARQRTILFGGGHYGSVYYNDTWEWNGINWTRLYPRKSPPARTNHAMVYDSARQRIVLFGGFYEGTRKNDTWEWNGKRWKQLYPRTSPSGRRYHSMAYDSVRQKTVLFGGYTAPGVRNDETWEWDGINWTLKSPINKPTARAGASMAYDSLSRKTILFGGTDSNETWEWNGTNWKRLYPPIAPSIRAVHSMVYDSTCQRIVLFGGGIASGVCSNDTWEYGNISLSTSNYVPTKTSKPVAWWKFDDIEGSTAFDSSGNNNHGRVYGATWLDGCLYFDGVNDFVKVPDSPVLRPSRITVETWVKVRRISQAVLLEKLPSGVHPHLKGWQIFINTETEPKNTFNAGIENGKNGTAVLGNTAIRTGRWYHIAMTYDGTSLNLYVNGVLDVSKPNTTGIGDNSAASLTIGYSEYWNYNYFNGLIKDTKIYNYARSAAQIKADYDYNLQYDPSLNYTDDIPTLIGWKRKANMPTARSILAIGVVNNKIYAIGGYNGSKILATNEEYDPVTNRWTTKAPMPTVRDGFAIGVVNNKIYAIGGWNNHSNFATNEEYDPVRNRWTTRAPMPTPRRCLAIGVVNNKIYAIGGYGSHDLNTVEEYNPSTNSWTKKSGLSVARHGIFVGVVNNKIYCIAGRTLVRDYNVFNTNEEYDPFTDSWTTKTNMPIVNSSFDIGVVNGKLYTIGGYDNDTNCAVATNLEYDPRTNVWTRKTDIPSPRCNFSIGVVNNKIYVIGGTTYKYNNIVLDANEQYDQSLDRPNIKHGKHAPR